MAYQIPLDADPLAVEVVPLEAECLAGAEADGNQQLGEVSERASDVGSQACCGFQVQIVGLNREGNCLAKGQPSRFLPPRRRPSRCALITMGLVV